MSESIAKTFMSRRPSSTWACQFASQCPWYPFSMRLTPLHKFKKWIFSTRRNQWYLSDPSPIIGNACHSLTDWLTPLLPFELDWCDLGRWCWQLKTCWGCHCCSCWWWKHVDNSLVQIWKVKFGHKVKFLSRLWAQGFKVWSRFWSWCWGKILKLKFGHYFATDAWLWLWSSILVEILKLCLVKILSLSLAEILMFGWDFEVNAWSRFWTWNLINIFDMNSTFGSVVPLAMFEIDYQKVFLLCRDFKQILSWYPSGQVSRGSTHRRACLSFN